ncbi:hypothetical protein NEF87_002168 [Candidatus Lokiarchaeum ossiferum]|uniref:Lipoprotein n=1 Tax=Candidatus Lokiarchaeum ossiferum TaxID=2951803 RepID=A0ABY6HQU7_9ARCH|nr:hypothetical protein NEF87_002168 [Candidatus Lokiarchaeum sp. B-35]
MKLNLNRLSGILMLYCMGGACACFPAVFIFRANYDPMAGSIFTIVGGSLLIVSAIFLLINSTEAKSNKVDLDDQKRTQIVYGLMALTVITVVVMFLLGEIIRF